jgi:hypothetical protein
MLTMLFLAHLAWLKGSVIFSCHINHADFIDLIDESNEVGNLLLSHFVAVQTLLISIDLNGQSKKRVMQHVNGMLRWLDLLHVRQKSNARKYFEWPMKRAEELRQWIQLEREFAPSV